MNDKSHILDEETLQVHEYIAKAANDNGLMGKLPFETFKNLMASHRAQTQYIQAQDEAAVKLMAENKRLSNIEKALNELPPGLDTQSDILAWLESTTGFKREVLDDTDKH